MMGSALATGHAFLREIKALHIMREHLFTPYYLQGVT